MLSKMGCPYSKMERTSSSTWAARLRRWAAHVAEDGLSVFKDGQPIFGNMGSPSTKTIPTKATWAAHLRRWAAHVDEHGLPIFGKPIFLDGLPMLPKMGCPAAQHCYNGAI